MSQHLHGKLTIFACRKLATFWRGRTAGFISLPIRVYFLAMTVTLTITYADLQLSKWTVPQLPSVGYVGTVVD
jgi:hypothetical protein